MREGINQSVDFINHLIKSLTHEKRKENDAAIKNRCAESGTGLEFWGFA